MNKLPIRYWLAITAILIAPGAIAADADEALQEDDYILEEVIVVGTRRQDRTALDTPVPIDVFGLEDLASDPSPELLDVLTTLVPSLNVIRQSLGDGASFMRQPTMRGLDSDKTLILVNGKRRHRGVLVTLSGFGSNGPDMASIPTNSLRRNPQPSIMANMA